MPLDHAIDPEQRLVTITGDYVDAGEWEAVLERVLRDGRYHAGFAFLRDLRTMSNPVDAATMVKVMGVVRAFWPRLQPSRAAMVTPRNFDPAALTAHAIADSYNLPIRMFTSEDLAMQWLRDGVSTQAPAP